VASPAGPAPTTAQSISISRSPHHRRLLIVGPDQRSAWAALAISSNSTVASTIGITSAEPASVIDA